jgi:hypothetical protein
MNAGEDVLVSVRKGEAGGFNQQSQIKIQQFSLEIRAAQIKPAYRTL